MSKIKFAVIEDEEDFLEDRCEVLDEIAKDCNLEVTLKARSSKEFFEKYNANPDNVDAMILDIDLGEGRTGLDIVDKIRKPALLASGFIDKYLTKIEDLADDVIIEHSSKPISAERLKKKVRSICRRIRIENSVNQAITITVKGEKRRVPVNDIVFLRSQKGSTKKMMYFNRQNLTPLVCNDLTFEKIMNWSVTDSCFYQISKYECVNINNVEILPKGEKVKLWYIDEDGNRKDDFLYVSPNYELPQK